MLTSFIIGDTPLGAFTAESTRILHYNREKFLVEVKRGMQVQQLELKDMRLAESSLAREHGLPVGMGGLNSVCAYKTFIIREEPHRKGAMA
ncbi:hypothetical protein ACET3Z_019288 [Daucus carota]